MDTGIEKIGKLLAETSSAVDEFLEPELKQHSLQEQLHEIERRVRTTPEARLSDDKKTDLHGQLQIIQEDLEKASSVEDLEAVKKDLESIQSELTGLLSEEDVQPATETTSPQESADFSDKQLTPPANTGDLDQVLDEADDYVASQEFSSDPMELEEYKDLRHQARGCFHALRENREEVLPKLRLGKGPAGSFLSSNAIVSEPTLRAIKERNPRSLRVITAKLQYLADKLVPRSTNPKEVGRLLSLYDQSALPEEILTPNLKEILEEASQAEDDQKFSILRKTNRKEVSDALRAYEEFVEALIAPQGAGGSKASRTTPEPTKGGPVSPDSASDRPQGDEETEKALRLYRFLMQASTQKVLNEGSAEDLDTLQKSPSCPSELKPILRTLRLPLRVHEWWEDFGEEAALRDADLNAILAKLPVRAPKVLRELFNMLKGRNEEIRQQQRVLSEIRKMLGMDADPLEARLKGNRLYQENEVLRELAELFIRIDRTP